MTRGRVAAALVCSVLALAGCSASGSSYAVLDRDAHPEDEVPAQLPASAGDGADLDSARFVGRHENSSLWLMRGDDDSGVCLLAYLDEATWAIGCASDDGPMQVGGLAGSFTVIPDHAAAPENATQISGNVYAGG